MKKLLEIIHALKVWRRLFLNAVSLVKDIMLDNIKEFYKDDAFFSILLESLSK